MSPSPSPTPAGKGSHDDRASPVVREVKPPQGRSADQHLPGTSTHVLDKAQTDNPAAHQPADTAGSPNPRLKFVPAVPTSPGNPLSGRTRNKYLSVNPPPVKPANTPVPSSPSSSGLQGVQPSSQPDSSKHLLFNNQTRCRQCKQPMNKVRDLIHIHPSAPC
jgi:hypothetical protein